MSTLDFLRQHKTDIEQLARQHGARHVRVFGSVARGEDSGTSDIDMLVSMDEDRSLLDLIALQSELEAMLRRRTDLLSDGGINPRLKDRILGEAVLL